MPAVLQCETAAITGLLRLNPGIRGTFSFRKYVPQRQALRLFPKGKLKLALRKNRLHARIKIVVCPVQGAKVRMRIVLREKATGLYYLDEKTWTPNAQQARAFENTWEALRFCREQKLPPTIVMMKAAKDTYDVAVTEC